MEAHCSVVTLMESSGSGVLVVTRETQQDEEEVTKSPEKSLAAFNFSRLRQYCISLSQTSILAIFV